jgi:hypothetical protein
VIWSSAFFLVVLWKIMDWIVKKRCMIVLIKWTRYNMLHRKWMCNYRKMIHSTCLLQLIRDWRFLAILYTELIRWYSWIAIKMIERVPAIPQRTKSFIVLLIFCFTRVKSIILQFIVLFDWLTWHMCVDDWSSSNNWDEHGEFVDKIETCFFLHDTMVEKNAVVWVRLIIRCNKRDIYRMYSNQVNKICIDAPFWIMNNRQRSQAMKSKQWRRFDCTPNGWNRDGQTTLLWNKLLNN